MEQSEAVAVWRRIVGRLSMVAVAAGATLGAFGIAGAATPVPQTGDVAVLNDASLATPLNSGGPTTDFQLRVANTEKCSKDTSSAAYHIYTYITSTDPGTEIFTAGSGPNDGSPLYDNTGTALIDQQTAIGGSIPAEPVMNFALFSTTGMVNATPTNMLAPGTYNVGIACATNTGVLDRYWNVQIVFTAASNDNGEVWALKTPQVTPTTTTTVAGATTTTSTTVAGATTTTSTTVAGATTTTSTTVAGGATTTSSSVADPTTTSSSVATTTSSSVPGTTSSSVAGTALAVTGGTGTRLLDWAVVLLLVGGMGSYLAHRRDNTGGRR